MRVFIAVLAILFATQVQAAHHKGHHRQFLAQGELHTAQNYQPWAWTNEPKTNVIPARGRKPTGEGWSSRTCYSQPWPFTCDERSRRHQVTVESKVPNFETGLAQGLAHTIGVASSLSSECRTAAHLGGPCGCFASEQIFGHSVRNLWLANNWLQFPHVSPAPGTAAVWPGRHVAPVVAVNGDGTVTVKDSWNSHHVVRMSGLVFVSPH